LHTIVTRGLGNTTTGASLVTRGFGSQEITPVVPTFRSKYQRILYERGLKFANIPPNSFEQIPSDGARLQHVNNVQTFAMYNSNSMNENSYSGAIRFRFRNKKSSLPSSINTVETRNLDEFGNVVLSFTGK
jgi:hypothetical protein